MLSAHSRKGVRPEGAFVRSFCLVFLISTCTFAAAPAAAGPALPGEPCRVDFRPQWTAPEKWAWSKICVGDVADFNERDHVDPPLDPKRDEGWTNDRRLSSSFLETVLLYDPFRSALTRKGVHIVGAWFAEPVDLESARIEAQLLLERSRFDGNVTFARTHLRSLLWMDGSRFAGQLNMVRMQVADDLVMRKAEFGAVDLRGAKIGGHLAMEGSKFNGTLIMESIKIAGALFMRYEAEFGEVNLGEAEIGSQLDMNKSTFDGKLLMHSMVVGSHVQCQDAKLAPAAELIFNSAKIGGGLDLRGTTVHVLDLSGATISQGLRPTAPPASEHKIASAPSRMTLVGASIGTLQGAADAWPVRLDLAGLTYKGLGGLEAEGTDNMSGWTAEQLRSWLARDPTYSPQPYEQLARVLREGGQAAKADDILYYSRERERTEVATGLDFLWKTALHAVVGYGYRTERVVLWIVFFVGLGVFVLKVSGEGRRLRMPYGVAYSFDMLLPVIRLRDKHYSNAFDLHGWARYYFYGHKITGWLLAAFLAAGVAALTK
jgi:hypothetical protein